jgi:hypothetical protein
MIGRLFVHEDQADFEAWMDHARSKQYQTVPRQGN